MQRQTCSGGCVEVWCAVEGVRSRRGMQVEVAQAESVGRQESAAEEREEAHVRV